MLSFPLASWAHVNSPDVYFDGYAGKYHLLVTITPPPNLGQFFRASPFSTQTDGFFTAILERNA